MKRNPTPSQVEILLTAMLMGIKVDRVNSFKQWGIADVRSRVSELSSDYGIVPARERVPNKRYLRYFIKP